MPRPGDGVGQPFGAAESHKKPSPFNAVVRRNRAKAHLSDDQCRHNPEIFQRRFHGRAGAQREQWVLGGQLAFLLRFIVTLHREIPDQSAHTGEQQHKANNRPNENGTGRTIVDERFGRPVLGIGDVRARAFGAAGPGGPEEEGVHELLPLGRFDGVGRDCVALAQFLQRRVIAEQGGVVFADLSDRRGSRR